MSETSTADLDYLRLAIAEAQAAEAAGEVPIGAIIVSPSGEIIGRGNNRECPPRLTTPPPTPRS